MKGFVHHTPTDNDIANIMTEFTVDFLLKGYRFLVNDMYARLSSDKELVRTILLFFCPNNQIKRCKNNGNCHVSHSDLKSILPTSFG